MKLPVVVRVNCPNCRNCLVPFEGSATALAKVVRTKKRMPLRCSDCGFRSTRIITAEQEEQAIKDRDLEARVLADRARIRLDAPIPSKRLPVTEPPRAPRRVRGDQVEGAAKLYHYAVYVKHPWGTDRLVVAPTTTRRPRRSRSAERQPKSSTLPPTIPDSVARRASRKGSYGYYSHNGTSSRCV
jgi:hypothetical protein